MIAAETEQGLTRLGVLFENTLPYSPYQNGKQEVFWGQIEGRLLPMLEGVADLTLDQLNEVSQPWVEMEYNRKVHSEIGQSSVATLSPRQQRGRALSLHRQLQLAFTTEVRRIQRRSDGTLTLEGIRFEIPSRFGHFQRLWLRYASWDLSTVYLADPKTGAILCRILSRGQKEKCRRPARAQKALRLVQPPPLSASGHGAVAPKDHPTIRH